MSGIKSLLVVGLGLALIGAWLPFASAFEDSTYHGLDALVRFNNAVNGGGGISANLWRLLPFIVMTAAYGIALILAVRLSDDSQPLVWIAGLVSAAWAVHVVVMLISIAEALAITHADSFAGRDDFALSIGVVLFIITTGCIITGLAGCWKELRDNEIQAGYLRLLERIQALEKSGSPSKPL